MENNNHLKIVKSSRDDNDNKKSDGQKPLSFDELIAKLNTLGTVQEREQCVVDNLKRKGLI